jgi:hypothetical protein
MGRAVLVGGFELQYDIAGAVALESFLGDGGAGDVAAQVLRLRRAKQATSLLCGLLGRSALPAEHLRLQRPAMVEGENVKRLVVARAHDYAPFNWR